MPLENNFEIRHGKHDMPIGCKKKSSPDIALLATSIDSSAAGINYFWRQLARALIGVERFCSSCSKSPETCWLKSPSLQQMSEDRWAPSRPKEHLLGRHAGQVDTAKHTYVFRDLFKMHNIWNAGSLLGAKMPNCRSRCKVKQKEAKIGATNSACTSSLVSQHLKKQSADFHWLFI